MRSIGILGGIGPQATMDFEARIHRVARQFVTQHGNTGYPPMVTVYMRYAPVLVNSDAIPVKPLVLDPRLLDTARRLGEWADLIVIPSNTPHLFLDPIRKASGSTIISMIDVTVEALHSRGANAVGHQRTGNGGNPAARGIRCLGGILSHPLPGNPGPIS